MRHELAAVSLVMLLGTGTAHAIDMVIVSGDSLSDGGNVYNVAGNGTAGQFPWGYPPSPPAMQRFSNGWTAVEVMAAAMGVQLQPSTLGGTNFAYGGATTGMLNFNAAVGSPPGLPLALLNTGMSSPAQLGQILATPFVAAETLFVVWGGPNDLFLAAALSNNDPAVVAQAAANAVMNLAAEVGQLAGAGAQLFLVPNMSNLGATPYGLTSGDPAALTALSQGFNAGLNAAMAQINQLPGVQVVVFDTYGFGEMIRANPGAYGFTNVNEPCLANLSALAVNCAGYAFFDGVHPTAAVHALLGDAFQAALVPEPRTWAMLAAGLLVLAVAARRRRGYAFG